MFIVNEENKTKVKTCFPCACDKVPQKMFPSGLLQKGELYNLTSDLFEIISSQP